MRNRNTAKIAIEVIAIARYEPPRLRCMTMWSGSNGCLTRVSTTTNVTSSTTAAISIVSVTVFVQLVVSACENP